MKTTLTAIALCTMLVAGTSQANAYCGSCAPTCNTCAPRVAYVRTERVCNTCDSCDPCGRRGFLGLGFFGL